MFFRVAQFFLMMIAVILAHAADQPTICYFALLPVEIRDKIALLVWPDRESDETFIERTKKYGQLLPEHKPLIKKLCTFKPDYTDLIAYSIDLSKIIIREKTFGRSMPFMPNGLDITVIDIKKDIAYTNINLTSIIQKNDHVLVGKKATFLIALSHDNNYFAQLQKWQNPRSTDLKLIDYETKIVVTACKTGEARDFPISYLSFPHVHYQSMGFNKQGTKLVVHHTTENAKTHKNEESYTIVETAPKKTVAAKSIMTFDAYLQTHGICKSVPAIVS